LTGKPNISSNFDDHQFGVDPAKIKNELVSYTITNFKMWPNKERKKKELF